MIFWKNIVVVVLNDGSEKEEGREGCSDYSLWRLIIIVVLLCWWYYMVIVVGKIILTVLIYMIVIFLLFGIIADGRGTVEGIGKLVMTVGCCSVGIIVDSVDTFDTATEEEWLRVRWCCLTERNWYRCHSRYGMMCCWCDRALQREVPFGGKIPKEEGIYRYVVRYDVWCHCYVVWRCCYLALLLSGITVPVLLFIVRAVTDYDCYCDGDVLLRWWRSEIVHFPGILVVMMVLLIVLMGDLDGRGRLYLRSLFVQCIHWRGMLLLKEIVVLMQFVGNCALMFCWKCWHWKFWCSEVWLQRWNSGKADAGSTDIILEEYIVIVLLFCDDGDTYCCCYDGLFWWWWYWWKRWCDGRVAVHDDDSVLKVLMKRNYCSCYWWWWPILMTLLCNWSEKYWKYCCALLLLVLFENAFVLSLKTWPQLAY